MSNNEKFILEYWVNSNQFSKQELEDFVGESLSKIISFIEVNILEKDKYLILNLTSTEKYIDSCYDKLDFDRDWSFITKDELGDSLRAQAYPLLANIEIKLRNFINQRMVDVIGFDWWDSFSPEKVRRKVEDIEKKATKDEVRKHHQIEFTFFADLVEIVTAKLQTWSSDQPITVADLSELLLASASLEEIQQKVSDRMKAVSLWDDIFAKYFDDKDSWINLEKTIIKKVVPVRNQVMHHRLLRSHVIEQLRKWSNEVDRVLKLAKSELSDTEIEDVKPPLKVITDQFSHHFYSDLLNSGMIDTRGVAALRETITSVMKDAAALSTDMRGSDALRETITSVMKDAAALSAMKINIDMSGMDALYKAASSMNNKNILLAAQEAAVLAAVDVKNLQKYVKDLRPPI